MSLYWRSNFVTGDFSEIALGDGGVLQFSPDNTQAFAEIVTSPVFSSPYAAMVSALSTEDLSGKSTYFTRFGERTLSEAYYGAALYIPSGLDAPITTNAYAVIASVSEAYDPYGAFAHLFISRVGLQGGALRFTLSRAQPTYDELWVDTEDLPLDLWFTIVFHLVYGAAGRIRFWKDGVLKADVNRDLTSTSGYPGGMFAAGLSMSGCPAQGIFIGEMRVASTYDLALPVPSVTPPLQRSLTVNTAPQGVSFTLQKIA